MARFLPAVSASHAKHFDIRLDDNYAVFRGSQSEAASAHLKGVLVLCLSEPMTIKHVKLHLTGMSHVSYPAGQGPMGTQRRTLKEGSFLEHTWTFRHAGKGKTETLQAGNYEFPFDIVLQGSLPESLEGLQDAWIRYRFKAVIGRKYAKNIIVRRPFRIIRTLDPTDLELAHVMAIENIWPDKLEYSISSPNKAVIFGTSVKIDFRLIPLLKGLKIGMISTQLIETCDLGMTRDEADTDPKPPKTNRIISTETFQVDSERQLEILNEVVEGYQFSRHFDLPKSLSKCVQDTDAKGIRIRHKLKFRVQLLNPDGHVSELRASLPLSIFISPHLPLDEENNLIEQSTHPRQQMAYDLAQQAPPVYGEHHFDQLYSELDTNGYQSPIPDSGAGSPFGTHSRNLSNENLANIADTQDLSATALQNRLNNLHYSPVSSPITPPQEPFPNSEEPTASNRLSTLSTAEPASPLALPAGMHDPTMSPGPSRRPSEEENFPSGVNTPHPQFLEVEDLSRVPSYTTAVRSNTTNFDVNLPDYQAATAGDSTSSPPRSMPTSPQVQPRRSTLMQNLPHRGSTLQSPLRAHTHSNDHSSDTWLRIVQARARS